MLTHFERFWSQYFFSPEVLPIETEEEEKIEHDLFLKHSPLCIQVKNSVRVRSEDEKILNCIIS